MTRMDTARRSRNQNGRFAANEREWPRMSGLDSERVVGLARRIHQARRILVVGSDLATSLASFLAYALLPLGFDAEAPVGTGGNLQHKVRLLSRKDLLVAISFTNHRFQRTRRRRLQCSARAHFLVSRRDCRRS